MSDNTNDLPNRQQLFLNLYQEVFPIAAKFIRKQGGNLEEAKDVFQDALIVYYERVVVGSGKRLNVDSNQGYLLAVTRNLWYKRVNEHRNFESLSKANEVKSEGQETHLSSMKLLSILETSGRKCLEILQSFYYHKVSMTDLASQFGFASRRSATVQKYKCLEKVRDQLKDKNITYEDFFERN